MKFRYIHAATSLHFSQIVERKNVLTNASSSKIMHLINIALSFGCSGSLHRSQCRDPPFPSTFSLPISTAFWSNCQSQINILISNFPVDQIVKHWITRNHVKLKHILFSMFALIDGRASITLYYCSSSYKMTLPYQKWIKERQRVQKNIAIKLHTEIFYINLIQAFTRKETKDPIKLCADA